MSQQQLPLFKGKYSGEHINEAGRKLIKPNAIQNEEQLDAVLDVLSYWRSQHDIPLKRAFEILQRVTLSKDRKAIFAKRLKRFASIVSKLRRFQSMNLKNMQDIGGCRAIVSNTKKLQQTLRDLKRCPEFRWPDGRFRVKDYIKEPKEDGYRSVHIVGTFCGETDMTRRIEVQLRTYIQHYWATALEIVDLFTDQALKSNQGDRDWRLFFRSVSVHFAAMDEIHLFEAMTPAARRIAYQRRIKDDPALLEAAKTVRSCCKRLRVVDKLDAFAGSLNVVGDQLAQTKRSGFVLLKINLHASNVETTVFESKQSTLAEAEYTRVESETAKIDSIVVALVSSTAVGGIKEAYPNYFADSSRFLYHLRLILDD